MAKDIFILSHTNGQIGGLNTLIEYFRERNDRLNILMHPLDDYSKLPTSMELPNGSRELLPRRPHGFFNLIQDFVLSVHYIRRTNIDIFIGANNFDTIPAIFCRNILRQKISQILYYPRDYSEERFSSAVLNHIYLAVERIAVKYSDKTVSNTKRAELARFKVGLNPTQSTMIPNPINLRREQFIEKPINKNHFVFIGDVSRVHGLHDLIEVISPIIQKLVIIGSGPDWARTVKLAKSKPFTTEIYFNKSHEFTMDFLQQFRGVGLAPYNATERWTHFCSPLKVGEYIAAGLPVLMSDIPEIAEDVKRLELGVVYSELELISVSHALDRLNVQGFSVKAQNYYSGNSVPILLSRLDLA
jgi:glycosyltransferase involved in cell wall biosynthesis